MMMKKKKKKKQKEGEEEKKKEEEAVINIEQNARYPAEACVRTDRHTPCTSCCESSDC